VKQKFDDVISRNRIFIWIAVATGVILLVPLIAMRFTAEVDWDGSDFIVMGCLLFGTSSAFVLAARGAPRRHRVILACMFATAFLYLWAELAVGVFTDLGS
jgi:hypothetical protein